MLWLAVVLAAAPLEVRVLEREVPTRIQLGAAKFTCDEKPLALGFALTAEVAVREVRVSKPGASPDAGQTLCAVLVAEDPQGVEVKVGEVSRRYPGQLRVLLEGAALRLINVIDVEAYLPAVVKAEADGSKSQALEAQAIVSRTFALSGRNRHERSGYQLCDLAHCQLYRGAGDASPEATAAVKATANQVLLIGGIVLKPAFFHSSCGGHTSRAVDVFGEDGAGSAVSDVDKGAKAPSCSSPDLAWSFEAEKVDFAKALGIPGNGSGKALEPLRRDSGGRILEVRAFGKRIPSGEFLSKMGRAFGWQAVRSMKFDINETDTLIQLNGTGLGHGVGLCQLGARALADKGVDAKGILLRYFPESQIKPAP
ncbi:MAG: SpoIID/LytB domain-containing protein [Myxococcaceae bacterium]